MDAFSSIAQFTTCVRLCWGLESISELGALFWWLKNEVNLLSGKDKEELTVQTGKLKP